MIKLLNANFLRIKKSKLFFILSLSVILVTVFMILNQYNNLKYSESLVNFDDVYNGFLVYVGIVISIFTCLFLSPEYLDGTIRNKIVIGHKRVNIYLANLLTVIIANLIFEILFLIIITIVGTPLFGFHISSMSNFFYSILMTQLIVIANASIYTFISMICSNGMLINVICILVAFGSYFTTLMLMDVIEAPEYIPSSTIVNFETGQVGTQYEKNPYYPSKLKKTICQTLMDIIPQSESIQIVSNKVNNKNILILYSTLTTVIFTSVGIIIFRKKEIK